VDLEERARAFMAALGGDPAAAAAFLSDRVAGDALPRGAYTVTDVAMKRNVTFVAWTRPGASGVFVLSWDQDGRVAHATVHA
jgi:hypothetical protein